MSNPIITACDLHRLLGMVVFIATLVRHGRLRLRPIQWWATTAWCQRTENLTDKITVPQWVLQEVAWWASPAVLQGLPFATQETEVMLFTDASNSGWGAQLGSRSIQGQWSASLRSSHINFLEMQAVINAVLPVSSVVQSGLIDVRQHGHGCLHQERRGHSILNSHAADHAPAEVVRSQGNQAGTSPSTRSAQCPGRCTVRDRQDSQHGVDVDLGTSTTSVFCSVANYLSDCGVCKQRCRQPVLTGSNNCCLLSITWQSTTNHGSRGMTYRRSDHHISPHFRKLRFTH